MAVLSGRPYPVPESDTGVLRRSVSVGSVVNGVGCCWQWWLSSIFGMLAASHVPLFYQLVGALVLPASWGTDSEVVGHTAPLEVVDRPVLAVVGVTE